MTRNKISGTHIVPTHHAKPLYGCMVQISQAGGGSHRVFLEPQFDSPDRAIKAGEKEANRIKVKRAR